MAKRLLMFVMCLLIVLATFGMAGADETSTGNSFFAPLNLNGDTLYLPQRGAFAVGVGTTIATVYEGIVELRLEGAKVVGNDTDPNLIGAGVGVKVRPLIEMLGGQWVMEKLNTSIGVVGLFNFNGAVQGSIFEPAMYVTVIGLEF